MKLQAHLQNSKPARAGVALIMVLILVGVSILILAGVMYRSSTVATLNERNNAFTANGNAAEAAVEKVYARLAYDFQSWGVAAVSNYMVAGMYATNIPTSAESPFWSNFQFSDPSTGTIGRTYVGYAYSWTGPLPSAYQNLNTANAPVYRIVSNVVNTNGGAGVAGVVGTAQEDVLLALVPLSTWAIFYNGLLEFTQCATMSVNGAVMANGSIYVGTTASLTFNSGVSASGWLGAPANDGQSAYSTWNTTFNATPNYVTNVPSVNVAISTGVTNAHALIDIPPSGESPTSALGSARLYNQAQMVLIVTNDLSGSGNPTVQLTIQNSVNGAVPGNDPAPTILYYTNASPALLSSNLPFLTLTNTFKDQREQKTALVTQLDMGKYATWAATNGNVQGKLPSTAGFYPTIMYVADRRNVTATQLPVVRLSNAAQLPANNGYGFSVATQNPLYTWGNYNTQTASSAANASASTTNTANTVPAALMSDALTILSSKWSDSASLTAYNNGNSIFSAADDTINAAIVTGTMPSTDTTATGNSGGVHNLPRLLENWTGDNIYLNTSILRLWNSNLATNQFRNPQGFSPAPVNPYYNPPTRHYAYDQNFLNPAKVPPGIPTALVPIRFAWCVPPPGVTNFVVTHN